MQSPIRQFKTHLKDEADTDALGRALAQAITPGVAIHLHGDLGAGKTALTRALLRGAGHAGPVRSPTYTLAETYQVRIGGHDARVVHFDLYRMAGAEEFLDAGFRDEFGGDAICIVEWPEKGESVLPRPDIDVFLSVSGTGREVELQALSDQGCQCLDRLHFDPAS